EHVTAAGLAARDLRGVHLVVGRRVGGAGVVAVQVGLEDLVELLHVGHVAGGQQHGAGVADEDALRAAVLRVVHPDVREYPLDGVRGGRVRTPVGDSGTRAAGHRRVVDAGGRRGVVVGGRAGLFLRRADVRVDVAPGVAARVDTGQRVGVGVPERVGAG